MMAARKQQEKEQPVQPEVTVHDRDPVRPADPEPVKDDK